MTIMSQIKYHFTCKNCGKEYLHNNDPKHPCPDCGTVNQTDGKI